MTDDQHGEGTPQGGGRWDPLPQGDYDDGATAFVKLPEGGIDALLAGTDTPLAAPGHGYVPPRIDATPDPGNGTWPAPADAGQWPDPHAVPQTSGDDRFRYNPGATGQWTFEDTAAAEPAPAAPGHDVTGEWSIPVAGGDIPDESGEFTTSSLVEQWGGTPPSTLPGGASAPWASQPVQPGQPGQPGQPWGEPAPDAGAARREHGRGPAAPETDRSYEQPHPHSHEQPGRPSAATPPAGNAVAASQPAHAHGEAPGAPESAEDVEAAVQAAHGAAEPPEEPSAAAASAAAADEPSEEDSADRPEPPASAEAGPSDDPAPAPPGEEHPLASYVLRVNGVERPVSDAWIGESLLYVLRERLGLAGAKDGCSQGECGACNVQVDGRLVASCLVPAVTAAGSEVRTVEGLAVDGQPSDVQRALARCGAVQCGFCVPGMAMTVHDLLEGNPAPTELETRQALCGNLCRCTGYRGVVQAVQEVVAAREAHGAADSETDPNEARIPHQAGPGAGGVNPSAFENQDGGQA